MIIQQIESVKLLILGKAFCFKSIIPKHYSDLDLSFFDQIKIAIDKLPNTKEQNDLFKEYIYNMQNLPEFQIGHVVIRREDITDVDSKQHVVLQGMDIILGSIQFKLNKEN